MRAVSGGTDFWRETPHKRPHIAARRLPGPMSDAEEDADAQVDDADDVDDGDTDALSDAFAGAPPRC